MARGRRNQDCGYGWMGDEGYGVEKTTTEPQTGGNRLRARNMSHTSAKAATIPLLPARRSFLMVDGDCTSELYTSVACQTVIYSSHQSSLTFNLSIHHPPVSRTPQPQHAHPFLVFFGFCCCLWEPFLLRQYLTLTIRIHPFRISSPTSPPSVLLPLTPRASHAGDRVFSSAC